MSSGTLNLDQGLREYLLQVSLREPPLAAELRQHTLSLRHGGMLSSPEQVQLLVLLASLMEARQVLEVGTFTGYTSLRLALALGEEARLTCCDTSTEWTAVGQRYWARAGVSERINLHVGPARRTLGRLLDSGQAETFDLAYVDADKPNYLEYYESCLSLLRPGGLLAVDNVLWGGSVINPRDTSADTRAIRALNEQVHGDERVVPSMVPIGDGLMLAYKCRHTEPFAGGRQE